MAVVNSVIEMVTLDAPRLSIILAIIQPGGFLNFKPLKSLIPLMGLLLNIYFIMLCFVDKALPRKVVPPSIVRVMSCLPASLCSKVAQKCSALLKMKGYSAIPQSGSKDCMYEVEATLLCILPLFS